MTTPKALSLTLTNCLNAKTPSLNLFLFCKKTKCLGSFIIPQASSSSYSSLSLLSRRQLITLFFSSTNFLHSSSSKVLSTSQEEEEEEEEEEVLYKWERLYLPINSDVLLLDHPTNHGGCQLGCRLTIFQTKDGGSISDAGANWKQLPSSSPLPGGMERNEVSSMPTRHYLGDHSESGRKEERPRFFDSNQKSLCWEKAATVPGRHPDRWRKDAAGNVVCKRFHNCQGCLCYEYDHNIPFSKGGQSVAENCQILQTRVNRLKSDKNNVKKTQLKGYSCDLKFTHKELDLIEKAVYGDVLRPGNQCRVGTVDEVHGAYKSKDQLRAKRITASPKKE